MATKAQDVNKKIQKCNEKKKCMESLKADAAISSHCATDFFCVLSLPLARRGKNSLHTCYRADVAMSCIDISLQ